MSLSNNAYGNILGTVGASATSITIKSSRGGLFPTSYPYNVTLEQLNTSDVVVKREIVQVTNRVGDTFTVVRGAESCPSSDTATTQGTTQYEFVDGDLFQLRMTAERITDIEDDVSANYTTLDTNKLDKTTYYAERVLFLSSSTGTDSYSITDSTVTSYVDGKTYKVKADVANTGAATLQVNSLGAKTLKKYDNTTTSFVDLQTGDIIANKIILATYNSTLDIWQTDIGQAKNISDANAATLTDGSDASSLHKHAINMNVQSVNVNASASGQSVTIAHGLGVTPNFVQIDCMEQSQAGSTYIFAISHSIGTFTPSGISMRGHYLASSDGTAAVAQSGNFTSSTDILEAFYCSGTTPVYGYITATITVDSTNINLSFTNTNTSSRNIDIKWVAQKT